eukprot:CAMPEP_0115030408 /NCGR_PEP_ID=MMETSP0216-20121206/37772_1 /TAXON_ID=223996 /ORGANISM="Protocruzia adherens, Strain Boccale" /LENGTH=127 /DNA_ID=CAMNT_0002407565 /DNA_START=174 /DNA_END=557 /DNA_ORIENTATION=+
MTIVLAKMTASLIVVIIAKDSRIHHLNALTFVRDNVIMTLAYSVAVLVFNPLVLEVMGESEVFGAVGDLMKLEAGIVMNDLLWTAFLLYAADVVENLGLVTKQTTICSKANQKLLERSNSHKGAHED